MNLFQASRQWSSRPADERFWTLRDMYEACLKYMSESVEKPVNPRDLRVQADSGEVRLVGKSNVPATLTHYAFGQLANRVGAPAEYLRRLPATLAAQNLNHGLARMGDASGDEDSLRLLLHKNGSLLARCVTSSKYTRIWNAEIAHKLIPLEGEGWRAPPARPCNCRPDQIRQATEADVLRNQALGLSVNVGDQIGPAGIYASDRDMFVFLIHEGVPLTNPADVSTPLNKGFFLWNSEVGDKSFGIASFLFDAVCGNHIVWGAREVAEIRIRHLGSARDRAFSRIAVGLRAYAESSVSDTEAKIKASQEFEIAAKKEDVIDAVIAFASKKGLNALGKKTIERAFDVAEQTPRFGRPNTPWGIMSGITVIAQEKDYASERVDLDRCAGKILDMTPF